MSVKIKKKLIAKSILFLKVRKIITLRNNEGVNSNKA